MLPYFYWNGEDSRNMGLWITQLPAPARAEERTQKLTVPGRAGFLTMLEGDSIYNGYVKECVVTAPATADFGRLTSWLRGAGKVVFGNEPDRAYTARIAGAVKFERVSNSLKQAVIPFEVQPYKERFPKESAITKTGTTNTIRNPGDVESRPIVTVTYTGSIEITIGGIKMSFTDLSSDVPIVVDCGAEIITKTDGTAWAGTFGGDFWRILPGSSTITMNQSGASISIKPEWRWV